MEKGYSHSRTREHRLKRNRKRLILLAIILFVAGCITFIAIKVSDNKTHAPTQELAKKTDSVSKDSSKGKVNAGAKGKAVSPKSDPEVEDGAFVEKYLKQQMLGQMPDGADGKKVAYLSFDDGPSVTVTPKILDILKKQKVKATFFIVGKEADENEHTRNIIKRIVKEGHAIGNHTYSHNYKYLYPNKRVSTDHVMQDIERNNKVLKSILGPEFTTRMIRFPGGHMTWNSRDPQGMAALDKVLHQKDYHQVDWNVLTKDAEGKSKKAPALINQFIRSVKGREKAIILMHDTYGKEETAKALPQIIEFLKKQGYEFKVMK
ncbi:polysaccharide deacetylase family protein [Paenibacillus sp. OT2-17]|jgi:peptidoglycan/xylan/chitin deacetylase (PgdA/CDA1 family)|uniref:polysaccharide deacetylase family protein n=1 Tax=unclassified Paenibacillus TaxID=185978 RepID=UPI00135598FD|nr:MULTISPECIES: polysaccharide deacetylase family protein [unclassified Paenibacillus]MBP1173697.1 peptidoglycan/xylan/chitin deacetylase (PgdA/CDA1 family) [Paenibacillus sp. PvR133]MXO76258.1 polysaccharide deacetylase family protein [Paenibacillus sp. OT2-17]